MTLGQRIQAHRTRLGLSQEGLGDKLGVSRQAVSKWEADGAVPDTDKLIALSRLFGITLNELLQVEEPTQPEAPAPARRSRRRVLFPAVLAAALVLLDKRDDALDEQLLHLRARQLAAAERGLGLCEARVVVPQVAQVLVRHVDVGVAAVLAVVLHAAVAAAARERVREHLAADRRRVVRQEDRRLRRDAAAHLALRARQRRHELAHDRVRLDQVHLVRHAARQPEVRVLVDRARDQTAELRRAQNPRERRRKRRRRLNRGEGLLADVGVVGEAEDGTCLGERTAGMVRC